MHDARRNLLKGMAGVTAATGSLRTAGAATIEYAATGARIIDYPPAKDGFSFPAEWAEHERTLMQFLPASSWYPKGADQEWAAVANAIAEFEPVTMALLPKSRRRAQELLSSAIELVE